MAGLSVDIIAAQIGFTGEDRDRVRALAEVAIPAIPGMVARLFSRLTLNPATVELLQSRNMQRERLGTILRIWLEELFTGELDEAYWARRSAIGQTHVREGLPQEYMLIGFEILWQGLQEEVARAGVPDADARLRSLHKLLSLEATVMLESYREAYTSAVREEERSMAEEKLTRSEHLAQLGQLAASLAHEIKNPLAGISGAIQVIRDGMEPENPHRGVIREILFQINRLDAAVKDLLVYARPTPPELRPTDLAALVRRTLKMLRTSPALKPVEVSVVADSPVPLISADARQIEQLVMNLLINAAHASQDDAEIRVELTGGQNWVQMAIVDHGEGMDEAVRARAFEPFFTTKARGTGLGLPICRKIVEAHRGTIELESARGRGTCVTVEFPVSPLQHGEERDTRWPQPGEMRGEE